jgi:hypothetical protein
MRIGIIGAGRVGATLGEGWTKAGHEVTYGLRDPDQGPPHAGARGDSVRGAVGAAEVVVLATPWDAVENALAAAGDLDGKPLLDATNPIGAGFALTHGHTTSGAELVASLARNARVVKAFNTTGFENMADPRYDDRRVLMPVAGDDPAAVTIAARLATDLGFEAASLPSLSRARQLEPFGLLWIKLALVWGQGRSIGYTLSRRAPGEAGPGAQITPHRRVITVVGSGHIGGALTRAWLRAGHEVRVATRDPGAEDVRALVALGAEARTIAQAAEGAEILVFATPAGAVVETARSMGPIEGKILVDCTNAIGKGFSLVHGLTTSSAEEVARALPGVKVVRSFNQQGAETLSNPLFGGHPATNFVAADDDEAREVVRQLSAEIGLDSVAAGPLSSSRYLEPMTVLWVALSQALGTREFGISLARR